MCQCERELRACCRHFLLRVLDFPFLLQEPYQIMMCFNEGDAPALALHDSIRHTFRVAQVPWLMAVQWLDDSSESDEAGI